MKKRIFISLCVVAALCASCTKSNPYLGKIPALAIAADEKCKELTIKQREGDYKKFGKKIDELHVKTNKKVGNELQNVVARPLPFVCADDLGYTVDSVFISTANWRYIEVEVYAELTQAISTPISYGYSLFDDYVISRQIGYNTQKCIACNAQSQCIDAARPVQLPSSITQWYYVKLPKGQKLVTYHILDARKCADFDHLEFVDEATYKSLR